MLFILHTTGKIAKTWRTWRMMRMGKSRLALDATHWGGCAHPALRICTDPQRSRHFHLRCLRCRRRSLLPLLVRIFVFFLTALIFSCRHRRVVLMPRSLNVALNASSGDVYGDRSFC